MKNPEENIGTYSRKINIERFEAIAVFRFDRECAEEYAVTCFKL